MLLQTSIYLSILKINASNFQGILLRDSTLQRHHELVLIDITISYLLPYPGQFTFYCKYLINRNYV